MKKSFLVVTAVVLFQVNISALTLNEAVNEVINTNPEVLEKVKDYNALRSGVEQSYSGYYPTIDIEGEIGYEEIKNASTNYETKDSNIDSARIVLNENIFNGFGTQNLVKKSKAKLNSAKFNYLDNVNKKSYETIESYLNLLKNSMMISLASQNIEVHERILSDIKVKIDNNVGKMSEYDRVAGRLAMANSQYILKQNSLKESVYIFHKLLGRFVRVENLSKPRFNDELLPLSLDVAIKKQLDNNPQLQSAKYDVETKKYDYEISKKKYYPKLDLEVSKGFSHNQGGVDGREDDFKAVLKLQYNLYNGNYDSNEKQKRISNLHSVNEVHNRIQRTILNDLQLSWSGYQVIEKQIPALRKNKFYMKKTLKAYKQEYKLGKRKLINILDAENEFYNAKVQLVTAQFNLLLQKFKILKAQGTLYEDIKSHTFLEDFDTAKELLLEEDQFPLNLEVDQDKILDAQDLCLNSIKGSVVMDSGCDKQSTIEHLNTQLKQKTELNIPSSAVRNNNDLQKNKIQKNKITVLDYINFDKGSVELSNKSKKIMRILLTQLKKVAPNSIIEINVNSNDFKEKNKNIVLNTQRGYTLKKNFLMNNVDSNAINIFPITESKKSKSLNHIELFIASDLKLANLAYNKLENNKIDFVEKTEKLTKKSELRLKRLAREFKNMGEVNIDILTYSHEYTNSLKNDQISQKRADLIKEFLQKEGVKEAILVPYGMGKYHDDAIFDIQNENQKKNLVEFVIK